MEKYCISVDWLQTFCHGGEISVGRYSSGKWIFDVELENHETQLYKKVYTVRVRKMAVATVLQCPRNSVMHALSTSVKLSNRVLYCVDYIDLLYNLQTALKLKYRGLTRVDICYDCNFLHGGRRVDKFLKQFICNEPFEDGHIIRSGSSRFSVQGTRKNTSVAAFNSVRFGSPRSKVGAYCYDKTLEMIEVKDKPWIREMWDKNGLLHEVDNKRLDAMTEKLREKKVDIEGLSDYVTTHVWRFEISIKSEGMDLLNMTNGTLFTLSPSYFEHYENIVALFSYYANKHFDFRIFDGRKRLRDYKKLQIFEDMEDITYKPVIMSRAADTGRMEKICYNKLLKLSREYADLALYKQDGLTAAMGFLLEVSGFKEGVYRMEREKNCINQFAAWKFARYDLDLYFRGIEELSEAKQQLSFTAEDYWEAVGALEPINEKDISALIDESLPSLIDAMIEETIRLTPQPFAL